VTLGAGCIDSGAAAGDAPADELPPDEDVPSGGAVDAVSAGGVSDAAGASLLEDDPFSSDAVSADDTVFCDPPHAAATTKSDDR
jgi:hypothetical protein